MGGSAIDGLLITLLHRDGGVSGSVGELGDGGKEEWKRFLFSSPIWLSSAPAKEMGEVFRGELAQTPPPLHTRCQQLSFVFMSGAHFFSL